MRKSIIFSIDFYMSECYNYIVISDNKKSLTLMPINNEYTCENVNIKDIIIFGKALRVTTEIK